MHPNPHSGGARTLASLAVVVLLFATTGASCPTVVKNYKVNTARVLPDTPTLEQVVAAVNGNAARVHSLRTTDATLTGRLVPNLRANIALERPRRFRLRADTALTDTEVDLGSNDEFFWFWVRRSKPPAVYFCRHDQFEASAARQAIPLPPEWLIEAFGVVEFSPSDEHIGPHRTADGTLEIHSIRIGSTGRWKKITRVDPITSYVLAQYYYGPDDQLVASAITRDHVRDPVTDVVLPRHIEISSPPADFDLGIHIRELEINGLNSNAAQLWAPPELNDVEKIDLGAHVQVPPPALRPAPRGASTPLEQTCLRPLRGAVGWPPCVTVGEHRRCLLFSAHSYLRVQTPNAAYRAGRGDGTNLRMVETAHLFPRSAQQRSHAILGHADLGANLLIAFAFEVEHANHPCLAVIQTHDQPFDLFPIFDSLFEFGFLAVATAGRTDHRVAKSGG